MKTTLIKRLLFLLLVPLFISSCEEDESGHGNYAIWVSNPTQKSYSVQVLLDGQNQGSFVVKAEVWGNLSRICNDLVSNAGRQNVMILNYVSAGTHKLTLKDNGTGKILFTAEFKMKADGCISQQFELQ